MKHHTPISQHPPRANIARWFCACLAWGILTGCAQDQAREFPNSWHPMSERNRAQPLQLTTTVPTTLRLEPLDYTLREVLLHFSQQSGHQLVYASAREFVLAPDAFGYAQTDLSLAQWVALFNQWYASYQLNIELRGNNLVLQDKTESQNHNSQSTP